MTGFLPLVFISNHRAHKGPKSRKNDESFPFFPFTRKRNETQISKLKLAASTPSSILGIGADTLSFLSLGFFLVQNPFFRFDTLLFPNRFRFPTAPVLLLPAIRRRYLDVVLAIASARHLFFTRYALGKLLPAGTITTQYQVVLLGLCGVGIVDYDSATKSHGGGTLTNQDGLFRGFRIELQDGPRGFFQNRIQAGKESNQASLWNLCGAVAVAQPLESRNRYASIERGRPEWKTGAHVVVHEISRRRQFVLFVAAFVHRCIGAFTATVLRLIGLFHSFVGHLQHIS
mmetsp:Transcript_27261/g.58348  ORF Transcript_27261/g.58348 Transcript_27261/m.58348 type:complete len:287 (-) Transcript_27261:19-879(-)